MNKRWLAVLLPIFLIILTVSAMSETGNELTITVEFDKDSVAVEEVIEATVVVSGGVAPYLYTYIWYIGEGGQEQWKRYYSDVTENTSRFQPRYGEYGKLEVSVSDQNGNIVEVIEYFEITGSEPVEPMTLSLMLDKESANADLGESLTASWAADGGAEPYSYSYNFHYYDENHDHFYSTGEFSTYESQIVFQPKLGALGALEVRAFDQFGRRIKEVVFFEVIGGKILNPLKAVITLDKNSVSIENGEYIKSNWKVSGGMEPYSYTYSWEVDGEYISGSSIYGTDDSYSIFMPSYGQSGVFKLRVTDSLESFIEEEAIFQITGSSTEPLEITVTLDKTTVKVGEPIVASAEVKGGAAYRSAALRWYLQDPRQEEMTFVAIESADETHSSTLVPLFGTNGKVVASVRDSEGRSVQHTAFFTVVDEGAEEKEPLVIEVKLNKESIAANETITGTWEASGGVPPYIYTVNWWLSEGEDSLSWTAKSSRDVVIITDQFTPTFGTSGRLVVHVTDSRGVSSVNRQIYQIIDSEVNPLRLSFTLDKEIVDASKLETITANWSISGGSGEYTTDTYWSISDHSSNYESNTIKSSKGLTGTSDSFEVGFGRRGTFSLEVKDSKGRKVYDTKMFVITGSQIPEHPLTADIKLSAEEIKGYQTISASVEASGGTGPYTYMFEWHTIDKDYEMEQFSEQTESKSTTSQARVPNLDSEAWVRVRVKDAQHRIAWFGNNFNITAVPKLPLDINDDGYVNLEDLIEIVINLLDEESAGDLQIQDLLDIINILTGD